MAGLGHARRLADDLKRFFSEHDDRGLRVTAESAFPGGRELVVTDGRDTASLFLFDSGTIVIEDDGKRVNYRLKQWEATIVGTR